MPADQNGVISPNDIQHDYLSLDNHANVCIFNNESILENIKEIKRAQPVNGLGGNIKLYKRFGNHPIFGNVMIDPDNKFNIVSLHQLLKKGYRYRTDKDNTYTFIVNKTDDIILTFTRDTKGGFYKLPISEVRSPSKPISLSLSAFPSSLLEVERERSVLAV